MSNARAVMDAAISEADFQRQVIQLAETCGWTESAYVRQKMIKLGSTNEVPSGAGNTPGATWKVRTPMPSKSNIPRSCEWCGRTFYPPLGNVRKGNGKLCSRQCAQASRRGVPYKSLRERFNEKYRVVESGCWQWTAFVDRAGYGRIRDEHGGAGESAYAHRVSYALHVGPIPDGAEIDHFCRNRWCVNPQHLEAVSHRMNVLRGMAPSVLLHSRGTCQRGHEINEKNTVFRKGTGSVVYCKVCRREKRAEQRNK